MTIDADRLSRSGLLSGRSGCGSVVCSCVKEEIESAKHTGKRSGETNIDSMVAKQELEIQLAVSARDRRVKCAIAPAKMQRTAATRNGSCSPR